MPRSLVPILLTVAASRAAAQVIPVDTTVLVRAFAVARSVVAEDGGRLWGHSLDGPLLVADPGSKTMFATGRDSAAGLTAFGSLFRASVPSEITPANTAVTWNGRRWTMVRWPLPTDPPVLRELLAHELWHRIQDSIGISARELSNGHLEREAARVWLRLEVRALARALPNIMAERNGALVDAVSFRAARYREFPGADSTEAMLERNEGLAEYTGIKLSGRAPSEQRARAARALRALEQSETVVRSFAYATGPGYALALDELRPGWRMGIRHASGLSQIVAGQLVGRLALGAELAKAARRYGLVEVRASEAARAERKAARRRDLVARFVTGPRLSVPLRQMNIGLDPDKVESLDSLGSVYGAARITDEWGALEAREGEVRVAIHWDEAVVPVPANYDGTLVGPGWKLDLKPGWRVVRAGPQLWRVERVLQPDSNRHPSGDRVARR